MKVLDQKTGTLDSYAYSFKEWLRKGNSCHLALLLLFTTTVAFSLFCSYTLAACINYMDPDQTAALGAIWSGFIVFGLVWKAFEYMQQT